jgi:hypothetical protein
MERFQLRLIIAHPVAARFLEVAMVQSRARPEYSFVWPPVRSTAKSVPASCCILDISSRAQSFIDRYRLAPRVCAIFCVQWPNQTYATISWGAAHDLHGLILDLFLTRVNRKIFVCSKYTGPEPERFSSKTRKKEGDP